MSVESTYAAAEKVNSQLVKKYRYHCGLESEHRISDEWSYNGVAQPGPLLISFFESPDGQNGQFYFELKRAGFQHHFFQAEYHWGVRMGDFILTYTEGDIAVFERPQNYQHPKP